MTCIAVVSVDTGTQQGLLQTHENEGSWSAHTRLAEFRRLGPLAPAMRRALRTCALCRLPDRIPGRGHARPQRSHRTRPCCCPVLRSHRRVSDRSQARRRPHLRPRQHWTSPLRTPSKLDLTARKPGLRPNSPSRPHLRVRACSQPSRCSGSFAPHVSLRSVSPVGGTGCLAGLHGGGGRGRRPVPLRVACRACRVGLSR